MTTMMTNNMLTNDHSIHVDAEATYKYEWWQQIFMAPVCKSVVVFVARIGMLMVIMTIAKDDDGNGNIYVTCM